MTPSYIVVQSSTDFSTMILLVLFGIICLFAMAMVDKKEEEKEPDQDAEYLKHLRIRAQAQALEKQLMIDRIQTDKMIEDYSKHGYISPPTLEHIESNTSPALMPLKARRTLKMDAIAKSHQYLEHEFQEKDE